MKILQKIFLASTIIIGFASCTSYLDVVPDNVATIDYAFRDRSSAEKYLYTCYSYRPQLGSIPNDPALNGGDETWTYYQLSLPYPSSQIARGFQNLTDPILNYWDGASGVKSLWNGIRDCNIFLENISEVHDLTDYEKNRWIAEVKFLKAYYHYFLFKMYGPIPIIDVNLPISSGAESVQVYRESTEKVVKYITDLMTEAAKNLPNASEVIEGTEAGRVDKLAALGIKAEVLLFAASPLFNGNTDYAKMVDKRGVSLFPQILDANKWKLAANAIKEAIDTCHMQRKALYDITDPLVPNRFKIQTIYRQAITDRWNKELVWGNTNYSCPELSMQAQPKIIRVSTNVRNILTEWSPTIKMAECYYSSNGVPINEDNEWLNKGWYANRFKVRDEAGKN